MTPDAITLITGISLGTMGLGWSIYRAGRDKRVEDMGEHASNLRKLNDELEADLEACRKTCRELRMERDSLVSKLASRHDG